MIGVAGAVVLMALGCVPWLRLNHRERPHPKPTPLRSRQLEREATQSQPITWRR
jgi:hypothetical protein